jgi:hypothetical protein
LVLIKVHADTVLQERLSELLSGHTVTLKQSPTPAPSPPLGMCVPTSCDSACPTEASAAQLFPKKITVSVTQISPLMQKCLALVALAHSWLNEFLHEQQTALSVSVNEFSGRPTIPKF